MNSVLLWLGGLLVAVLALLFAVPYAIDWNSYRGVFEEEATRILGREVRVGGKVNLRLLPSPYVRFEKVRIADTEAVTGEPFFKAEAFTLWLSAPPLLRGSFEVNRIELDGPVLHLAVDSNGRGNWQSLQISPGAMQYMPSDIVLQNVRISDGGVSMKTPNLAQPAALTGIDGELSATALGGPYRFRGTVDWNGRPRELRVATGAKESDGSVRFKASVHVPDSGGAYSIDGAISELTAQARLTGKLSAQVPIPGLQGATDGADRGGTEGGVGGAVDTQTAGQDRRDRADRTSTALELKSSIEGGIETLSLPDISIAFEQDGKPQLLTGQAVASWKRGFTLRTKLDSRWLDIDRVMRAGSNKEGPLETTRQLISRLGDMLPAEGSSLVVLDVDQINLGGDSVSGVRLALARAGGLTSIGELKAALPGNTRAQLRGTLAIGASSRAFKGEILLHGTSYKRFSAWALGASGVTDVRGDGAFSLASGLQLRPDNLTLDAANLEFGSTQIVGDLGWHWGKKRELKLKLDGTSVDLSSLVPDLLDVMARPDKAAVAAVPGGKANGATVAGASIGSLETFAALGEKVRRIIKAVDTAAIDVHALHLTDGTRALHDVTARFKIGLDGLSIDKLRFSTPDGLDIDLQGTLDRLDSKPTGRLRGWASAANARGVASLTGALPIARGALAPAWMGRVSSAEMGFTADFGQGAPDHLTFNAGGLVNSARVVVDMRLDGGLDGWRSQPADLSLRIESADLARYLRRLSGAPLLAGPVPASQNAGSSGPASAGEPAQSTAGPGTLILKATGSNASALTTLVRLQAPRLSLAFSGRSGVAEAGLIDLDGRFDVKAARTTDLMMMAGATAPPRVTGTSLEGTLQLARTRGATVLTTGTFKVGGIPVAGRLSLSEKPGGNLGIDGSISAERASLPGLLGLVLDGGVPTQLAAAQETSDESQPESGSPWTNVPFALGVMRRVEGKIALTTPRLDLQQGLRVRDAALNLDIKPGLLTISSLSGAALGGRITVGATLRQTPAGAQVSIDGRLVGAQLDRFGTGGSKPGSPVVAVTNAGAAPTPLAGGSADVMLKVSGRALSPRAAIAAMTGSGQIMLRKASVPGLSLSVIDDVATELIEADGTISAERLETAVRARLGAGRIVLGNRKLGIGVTDGAARIASFNVESGRARATNTTTIDFSNMKIDSEWQLVPLKPPAIGSNPESKAPLPAVTLVWAGAMRDVAGSKPRISVSALERELMVRKMERDVERLEDLRRQDAERARLEAERLRREQAARGLGPPPQPDRQGDLQRRQRGGWTVPSRPSGIIAPLPVPAPISAPGGIQTGPARGVSRGVSRGASREASSGRASPASSTVSTSDPTAAAGPPVQASAAAPVESLTQPSARVLPQVPAWAAPGKTLPRASDFPLFPD